MSGSALNLTWGFPWAFSPPVCLPGLLSACTAQNPTARPPATTDPEIDVGSIGPSTRKGIAESHPAELRYGRYTLVSVRPTTEQRDLLAQIIDVKSRPA